MLNISVVLKTAKSIRPRSIIDVDGKFGEIYRKYLFDKTKLICVIKNDSMVTKEHKILYDTVLVGDINDPSLQSMCHEITGESIANVHNYKNRIFSISGSVDMKLLSCFQDYYKIINMTKEDGKDLFLSKLTPEMLRHSSIYDGKELSILMDPDSGPNCKYTSVSRMHMQK